MNETLEQKLSGYANQFLEKDNYEIVYTNVSNYMQDIAIDTTLIKNYEQACIFQKRRYEKDSNSKDSNIILDNWAKNSLVLSFLTLNHIDKNKKGGNLSFSAKPLFDLFEKTRDSNYLKKIIFLEERAIESLPIVSNMLLINSYSNLAKAAKVYVKSNQHLSTREKIYYLEKNINSERYAADFLLLNEDIISKKRAIESLVYATWSCIDLFSLTQQNKYLHTIENLSRKMINFSRKYPDVELPSKFKTLSDKITQILQRQKRPKLTLVK